VTLQYAPFAASSEMQAAARNQPALHMASMGRGVALLQAGYIQLGFAMPRSLRAGIPDGIFGPETVSTTRAFQAQQLLHPDGVAGKETVARLDALLYKASAPPPPPPPAPPPPVSDTYMLGASDPPLRHDPGAGPWNSRPKELAYIAAKVEILKNMPYAAIAVGDDAAKHLYHYFGSTGLDYIIDLEGMVDEVPSAKTVYTDEIAQMQEFVEQLGVGSYQVTSRRLDYGYNEQAENRNWFCAIGGYSVWGKGNVKAQEASGVRIYDVDFEYKFYDRYNWDAGKSIKLGGITITDKFLGEFHRQGLAKEFNCYGSFKRKFSWKKGEAIARSQIYPPRGRGG
jgi:hypothetical protein